MRWSGTEIKVDWLSSKNCVTHFLYFTYKVNRLEMKSKDSVTRNGAKAHPI